MERQKQRLSSAMQALFDEIKGVQSLLDRIQLDVQHVVDAALRETDPNAFSQLDSVAKVEIEKVGITKFQFLSQQ